MPSVWQTDAAAARGNSGPLFTQVLAIHLDVISLCCAWTAAEFKTQETATRQHSLQTASVSGVHAESQGCLVCFGLTLPNMSSTVTPASHRPLCEVFGFFFFFWGASRDAKFKELSTRLATPTRLNAPGRCHTQPLLTDPY